MRVSEDYQSYTEHAFMRHNSVEDDDNPRSGEDGFATESSFPDCIAFEQGMSQHTQGSSSTSPSSLEHGTSEETSPSSLQESIDTEVVDWQSATPFCTQSGCSGPSELPYLNTPVSDSSMMMQYNGPGFALTYEQWGPQNHHFEAEAWQQQQQQAMQAEPLKHFLNALPQTCKFMTGANTSNFISDVESSSYVEAAVMRRSSTSVLSSLAIAAGMRSSYNGKFAAPDQTLYSNMCLDQHVMSTIVAPRHHSGAVLQPRKLSTRVDDDDADADDQEEKYLDQYKALGINRCGWVSSVDNCCKDICGATFDSPSDLTEHIKLMHVGARRKSYTCQWLDCDRRGHPFPQKQKIMRHLVVHTNDRPFQCEDCDYACSEETALKQHRRKHTGEKPFECHCCQKRFRASTSLSVHLRTHTGEKPLQCKFCTKRFGESSNMAKHMRTHSPVRPHQCDIGHCRKTFQRPDQLKRHKKLVHKLL